MKQNFENIKKIARELHDIPPICYLTTIQNRLAQIIAEVEALEKEIDEHSRPSH